MLNIFKPQLPPNFEVLELQKVCRICLHSTNDLLPLFNHEIDSIISEFLPQKIIQKPLQPHQICVKCLEESKIAYAFKKQCEYSDSLIKSMLNEPIQYENIKKSCEKETQTNSSNFVYPCEKCEKRFESLEILREHRLKQHYKTSNTCRECGKDFMKIGSLRDHLGSAHPELGFVNNNKCNLCKKIFTRKDHLKRHLKNIHSVLDNTKEKRIKIRNPLLKEEFSKINKFEFYCQYCSQSFEAEDEFKIHECPLSVSNDNISEPSIPMELVEIKIDCDQIKKDIDSSSDYDPCFENNLDIAEQYSKSFENSEFSENSETFESLEETKSNIKNKNNENNTSDVKNNTSGESMTEELKATQEILKSMIRESKMKIPIIKVKPNPDGKYECETCHKIFTRGAHLTRHQLLHSGDPKPYACTMCTKTFSRSDHLKNHVNGFHADFRPFKCLTCDKSFTRNEHLKRHGLICSTERTRNRKEKLFSCDICQRKFSTEKYVQDHKAVQHNETKEFTCKYCSAKIIGATEYKKHCKGHYNTTTKQFLCSECGGSFTKLQYLMIHIRRHTGEKPFKCRYCDKAFPRTTDQYAHERSHTGEKNFQCTNCPKAFSTSYKLRVHMRIHTGERPYKCLYCPKAFAQNNDLKAHHRRHTGERFHCNLCDLGFVQMYLLRQHKRQVHGVDEPRIRTTLLDKTQIKSEQKQFLTSTIIENKILQDLTPVEEEIHATEQTNDNKNEIIVCGLDSQDKIIKLITST